MRSTPAISWSEQHEKYSSYILEWTNFTREVCRNKGYSEPANRRRTRNTLISSSTHPLEIRHICFGEIAHV